MQNKVLKFLIMSDNKGLRVHVGNRKKIFSEK